MGKKVHIDAVRRFAKTTPVFTARDVELLVGKKAYALLMLHQMEERGEIHRISRGFYSVHDDPVVFVFALRPAYVGLQDALSIRALWEQETNVVVVTSGRAAPGERNVLGSRVIVHRIHSRYFFGFDYLKYHDGIYLPVSNLEKTIIDLAYFGELPGDDVMRALLARADKKLLERYLSGYGKAFVTRVRGIINSALDPVAEIDEL